MVIRSYRGHGKNQDHASDDVPVARRGLFRHQGNRSGKKVDDPIFLRDSKWSGIWFRDARLFLQIQEQPPEVATPLGQAAIAPEGFDDFIPGKSAQHIADFRLIAKFHYSGDDEG